MPELLEQNVAGPPVPPPLPLLPVEVDERGARRALLDQVARLESELAALFCST